MLEAGFNMLRAQQNRGYNEITQWMHCCRVETTLLVNGFPLRIKALWMTSMNIMEVFFGMKFMGEHQVEAFAASGIGGVRFTISPIA